MANLNDLRIQDYSSNIELLFQQKKAKLALNAREERGVEGKAVRMLSQVGETSVSTNYTLNQPVMNAEIGHDSRWVYSEDIVWGTTVNDIQLLETNIRPQGVYVTSAVSAVNRERDAKFLKAFFGDAKTGETGDTTTSFDTNNVVGVTTGGGGSATGMNVEKLREVKKMGRENNIDFEMYRLNVAVSPHQYDELLAQELVSSGDYNRTALADDNIGNFLGINFIISNLLETDANGYRRNPVWVDSAMGRAVWKEAVPTIRKLPNIQNNPDYIEVIGKEGYTRLNEQGCFEIKCDEA